MKTENTDKKPSLDLLKRIGQRIRETRIDRGLNQAELAFRANERPYHSETGRYYRISYYRYSARTATNVGFADKTNRILRRQN